MKKTLLHRKRKGNLCLGICAGISEKTSIPTWILRITAILLQIQFIPFLIIIYILGYYFIPLEAEVIDTSTNLNNKDNTLDDVLQNIDHKLSKLEKDAIL
jgi:phage shock protein PspC (stress-responsive transcriptional regulator)